MSKDPTGFETALATIPEGQLSERQHRLATAISMVREGKSQREAARACGVAKSTLYDALHRSGTGRENSTSAELQVVHDLSHDIATIAGEAVRDSLSNDLEEWKPGELVKAYGVAVDKIVALHRTEKPTETGVSALAELLKQADVTITKRPADADAIDVEAAEDE